MVNKGFLSCVIVFASYTKKNRPCTSSDFVVLIVLAFDLTYIKNGLVHFIKSREVFRLRYFKFSITILEVHHCEISQSVNCVVEIVNWFVQFLSGFVSVPRI